MKNIVLVEYSMSGHHRAWLLQFARSFLDQGCRVTCLCPEPGWMERELANDARASSFSAAALDARSFEGIPVMRLRNAAGALARWRAAARAIPAALKGAKPDLVFFAMFDGLFEFGVTPWLVDRLFPYPWAALYFHPGYDRKTRRSILPRSDAALRAGWCRAVAVLDEGAAESLRRYVRPKPVITFPDFIVPAEERLLPPPSWIEEIRGRAGDRTVVVAAGSLTPRKGISTLMRLARRAEARDFFFVFAGRLAAESFEPADAAMWKRAIAEPPENCLLRLGTIAADSEFNRLIAASDVVYAAYHDFRHSSNLLAKAARFGRPIIVSRGFCMEERVRRFSLGEVVGQDDEAGLLAALGKLRRESRSGAGPARDAAGYLREHSIPRLEERLRELLAAAGCV